MREIVFVTENTGLDPISGDRLVEIGCIEMVNRFPTGKVFHRYLSPERDMPESAFKVHRLSVEFLKDKPLFAGVLKCRTTASCQPSLALPMRIGCLLMAIIVFSGTTHAIDTPPTEDTLPTQSFNNHHVAIDSSAEFTSQRNGWFYTNLTAAPVNGFNTSGLRFRVTTGANWYRYVNGENPRTYGSGHSLERAALIGFALPTQRFGIIGLVGLMDVQSTNEGVHQTKTGAKANLVFYAFPTDQIMSYGTLTYSTTISYRNKLEAQAKMGMKVPGDSYLGPEVRVSWRDVFSEDRLITETKIGLHLSSMKVGPLYLGLSGGFAHSRQLGWGSYSGISVYGSF
jgi:Cellulose biosynthesis protein BcsS/Exonuclease